MAGRMLYEFGSGGKEELRSEAQEWRKWVIRVSELRTGGKLSIGRFFLLFLLFSSLLFSSLLFSSLLFSSLLHTLLLLWISAQYKWRRHGFLTHPDCRQVEVEFPRESDPPTGHAQRY